MTIENRTIHLIGNAHLDPVWLWQWPEGFAEIKATFRAALDRINEFEDFVFTCSAAAYYQWVEDNEPEMFREIQRRVAEGRWVIVGGWWIQPDCNLPNGESFVRQGLYGQRYFLSRFGVQAAVGYNVDSFGHNAMLPQLLAKSGLRYYVFQRPDENERTLAKNLFWWESEDGSRVMAFRLSDNYSHIWSAHSIAERTNKHRQISERDQHDYMSFYGVGNHGGGPTIANILEIYRLQENEQAGVILFSSPDRYFAEMEQKNPEIPLVKDELQFHARGCYSAHSETKANNRKAEHRLLSAEKFSTVAHYLCNFPYPAEKLKQAWENVMFCQFHDIAGGCSIKEAYDDVREFFGESLTIGAKTLNAAIQKLSWSINTMKPGICAPDKNKNWLVWEQADLGFPVVVFNPLTWKVDVPIQLTKEVKGITDEQGVPHRIQQVRGSRTNRQDKWDTLFMASIPAMGYRVYWAYLDKPFNFPSAGKFATAKPAAFILENELVYVEINPDTGWIARIYDKRLQVEVLQGSAAVPIVIDEYNSDTWAHGIAEFREELGKFSDASVVVLEEGPLRSRIRTVSRYGQSELRQDFMLSCHSPDLLVQARLDWREKHKMLKLSFPVRAEMTAATYEIPYGFLARPANGEEVPGQQWLDVSGYGQETGEPIGLALLNDSKYSFDVLHGEIRMTVVRSPIFADHYAQHAGTRDEYCEFMDQGVQEFTYALVPHSGSWRDSGIVRRAYELNTPPFTIIETYHAGLLPQSMQGILISSDQVIATVFKKAEDGNGYILRCYETNGYRATTEIELPFLTRKWSATFGKCEIKTFFIPIDKTKSVIEVNLIKQTSK